VIVDAAGLLEQKLSFGPWGQRRDASNWEEVEPVSSVLTMIDLGPSFDVSRTTRGFTGHEMVDSVGIVHMNGRIYDPFLGRFLQTDNYVQESHNRYSYVWNNPLNATDPSGEFVFTLIAMAIVAGVEGIKLYAMMAIFAVAGTLDALMAGADLSDAFLSGVISGLSAGAFSGVGNVLGGKLGEKLGKYLLTVKVLAHGAIGGITSVLQGGKFGHGFAAAAFTAGATKYNNSGYFGGEGFSWQRVAVGAAIGGTASRLSGGKFANGAMTGAFSQALNAESSQEIDPEVVEYNAKVSALIKGVVEVSTDFESLSIALQTDTKVQLKIRSDGTITVTSSGGKRVNFDGGGLLDGAGLKGKYGTIDLRINRNGQIRFSGKISTPIEVWGMKIKIGFGATVNVKSAVYVNSGLLGQGARALNPATRRERIDNAMCMANSGLPCGS